MLRVLMAESHRLKLSGSLINEAKRCQITHHGRLEHFFAKRASNQPPSGGFHII